MNNMEPVRHANPPPLSLIYVMKLLTCLFIILSLIFVISGLIEDISTVNEISSRRLRLKSSPEQTKISTEGLERDKESVVRVIKSNLVAPSDRPYNLRKPFPVKPHVLERAVRQITNTTRGTFVEIGAGDGETRSPTLCLEIEDGWSGLLVEANPQYRTRLEGKHRRAYISHTCVGLYNYSYVGELVEDETRSYLLRINSGYRKLRKRVTSVDCYPLYSHLLAFGSTTVDFLVVNVNGREADILNTLPWSQVNIKAIAVANVYDGGIESVEETLVKQNYTLYRGFSYLGETFELYSKTEIPS